MWLLDFLLDIFFLGRLKDIMEENGDSFWQLLAIIIITTIITITICVAIII